ncbi:hypothetical protein FT663_05434 [Candidozyma haemuli var. vulneris]|uniref:Uncharacterized protein n=1 Tax=Candidozyma haemuli TaxID=45357 RepID=A0A2V1ATP3_9ASCO|nr:hypothetical protein CXQ85_000099 [[Candida] haemuloni]KAF3985101.1 hypothetical protein FT663_05434 [[Candida] haemuloni var. vulneris]KAF3990103.1 hypothetical protein FT662_02427 [[Candida] haemuloni var. vulneris]PVH21134.1 hypothetical protein CXQ85_000099 [[Candida] haemuloni]
MSEPRNVEPIESASELLNSTLRSKGYIKDTLRFPSIDWNDLTKDQPDRKSLRNFEVTNTIFDNDKNVINILYSLLRAIDRHNDQQKALYHSLSSKNKRIEVLEKKVESLSLINEKREQKLERVVQVDQTLLEKRNADLLRTIKKQSNELARLKSWTGEIQTKYDIEVRKKNIEISQLKDKVLDSRDLSYRLSYGRADASAARSQVEINPSVIHNNIHTIDNDILPNQDTTEMGSSQAEALKLEYDGIANQLSELSENLIKENSKYAHFVEELNTYFDKLNTQLSSSNYKNLSDEHLVNPSDEIDLARILEATNTEVDPFDHVSSPLLSNVYKNNHYVTALVDLAISGGKSSKKSDEDEIERLRTENAQLYENLDEAVQALERWQKYAPGNPNRK